jgi:hypothetical protein
MRMVKQLPKMIAAVAVLATSSLEAGAQGAAVSGVAVGYSDIAGVVGLGGIGEASIALGARYEKIIRALPDMVVHPGQRERQLPLQDGQQEDRPVRRGRPWLVHRE